MGSIKAPCPLYAVCTTEALGGLVLAAGGGGSSKTGIPNAIIVLGWDEDKGALEVRFTADAGHHAVTSITAQQTKGRDDSVLVAYGHANRCTLSALRDGAKALNTLATVTTVPRPQDIADDDDPDAPEQKCCAFGDSLLFTGSSTGVVRAWTVPAMRPTGEFTGHAKPVTCVAARGEWAASTSADGDLRLWRVRDSQCVWRASAPSLPRPCVVFRGCAFVPAPPGPRGVQRLALRAAALRRSGSGSMLCSWDVKGEDTLLTGSVMLSSDTHTAFAACGDIAAVGTGTGHVGVSRAGKRAGKSAQRHGLVVTGVTLTPAGASHVVSVGPDSTIMWTKTAELAVGGPSMLLWVFVAVIAAVLATMAGFLFMRQ